MHPSQVAHWSCPPVNLTAKQVASEKGYTDITLYILDQDVIADVRHTLLFKPYVLISDISGNEATIEAVLTDAGNEFYAFIK